MNRSPALSSRAVPFFCLFVSGAASLVYELLWIRQLALVFGSTLYAISAVLCAFMIGLALGAWAIGRFLNFRAERKKPVDPVRLYGFLEAGIALYALFFPYGLDLLAEWYAPLVTGAVEVGLRIHLIEFALSTALMLPATMFMGATLPLIGSWAIGDRANRVVADVSVLYSLNTFGAVAGCLYTQMFAVKFFGIAGTNVTAVLMNVLVFVLCVPLRQRASPAVPTGTRSRDDADAPAPERGLSLLLLLIFIYSGMASLSSQVLWTRVLVFPMGTTLYSFALILATFLFGIALGSLIAEKLLGDSKLILKFLLIELMIAVVCIAILPLFEHLHEWTLQADHLFYDLENVAWKTLGVRSLFAFGLMFLPTLGFGLIFPLANRIHLNLFGTVSGTLGNSYAFNTLGAVLGAALTPFVFIPLMGIRLSLFVIYAVLIILCFAGLALHFKWTARRRAIPVVLSAALVLGGYAWSTPQVDSQHPGDHNLARTEVNVPKTRTKLLEYKEGDFATLSVTEDMESGARTLYMNGFSTATVSDSIGGSAYMQAMGFVPMVLHPDPKRALVICFGTGNTTNAVSLFPGVEVDAVEIDRNVLSFAHLFAKWNRNVLDKPNVRMHVQDGRTFMRWTQNKYDVITLEPMSPVQAGTVNLYSREFYQLAADRLNAGGLMMQWLPLHLVGPDDARSIVKTFQEVFPHTSVWNSFLTRIVLLVGSKKPVIPDKIRFDELMRIPEINEAARQMGVYSFLDFTDFFLTDGERIKPFVESAAVVTDDRPLLEFSHVTLLPPVQWQVDETFLNLLRYRVGHLPKVRGLIAVEESRWRRNYHTRTAQRLGIFARRYHGPGERAFAEKNYPAGLESVKSYLDKLGDKPIRLHDANWD
ncbi:MAG: fused MFS/spermidine synthase [Nitrospinae bacterium]|nr:fused MFS/spermidine synthase [Nitrospinota bacterium]